MNYITLTLLKVIKNLPLLFSQQAAHALTEYLIQSADTSPVQYMKGTELDVSFYYKALHGPFVNTMAFRNYLCLGDLFGKTDTHRIMFQKTAQVISPKHVAILRNHDITGIRYHK